MATSAGEALALRALEPHQETELEDDRPRQVPAGRRAEACRTEKSTSVSAVCAFRIRLISLNLAVGARA